MKVLDKMEQYFAEVQKGNRQSAATYIRVCILMLLLSGAMAMLGRISEDSIDQIVFSGIVVALFLVVVALFWIYVEAKTGEMDRESGDPEASVSQKGFGKD